MLSSPSIGHDFDWGCTLPDTELGDRRGSGARLFSLGPAFYTKSKADSGVVQVRFRPP